jgi:hypothetical protein
VVGRWWAGGGQVVGRWWAGGGQVVGATAAVKLDQQSCGKGK